MAVRESSLSPFSFCFASAKKLSACFCKSGFQIPAAILYSRYHSPGEVSRELYAVFKVQQHQHFLTCVRIPRATLLKTKPKNCQYLISSATACQWCRPHLPHNESTQKTSLSRLSPDVQKHNHQQPSQPALHKIRPLEVSEQRLLLPLQRGVPRSARLSYQLSMH